MVYRVSRSVFLTFEDTKCGTIIYGESGNGKKKKAVK